MRDITVEAADPSHWDRIIDEINSVHGARVVDNRSMPDVKRYLEMRRM